MIDLTLNSFLHPDILGLQPQFGTVIISDAQNKGGLSTAQVDNNMSLPFALMRPILVGQTDTTSQVEYDAKLLITGDQVVSITLGEAVYDGCIIQITHRGTQESFINNIKLKQNEVIQLTWYDSKWNRVNNAPAIGHVYIQFRKQSAPADLYPGTTWTNISSTYAGRFFRAEGGSAAAFGSTQAGGLPNITGGIEFSVWQGTLLSASCSGAFVGDNYGMICYPDGGGDTDGGSKNRRANLNASRSSSLYGSSSEVRPVNETFRIWKRTG